MRKLIMAVLVTCCTMLATSVWAEVKIGVVDMQSALNSSDAGKDAKEQLAARLKKYQDEINSKQDELKRLKDELEKQSMLLAQSARDAKEKDYQQKLKEFQRFTKDAQDELQGKDEEYTRKIIEDMDKVIKDYGKKNGYAFVFVKNESLMLYTDEAADITSEILKIFNASRKK